MRTARFRTVPSIAALTLLSLALAGCGGGADPEAGDRGEPGNDPTSSTGAPPQVDGLVVYASEYDVEETVDRVTAGLEEIGMVAATVDHAAAAAGIGEELRPTTLVIGGSPAAGTPIMLEDQRAGIDLPQKYLAWQAEDGAVYLGYNSVEYVAGRAGIATDSPALDVARMGSAAIAAEASGSGEALSDGTEAVTEDGYLVAETSDATVAESIARYEAAFEEQDLMAVASVDHAAGAASVDETLRPTATTFVGNAMVGTVLLQSAQTFGIDLPVRYLAWEDADGMVQVAHPDIRVLAERHGADDVEETLAMVEAATGMFNDVAAGAAR